MKTNRQQITRKQKSLRVKKLLKYQALLLLSSLVLFVLSLKCIASSTLIISAVKTSGTNSNDDFIEIYNKSCDEINLSDWKLKKRTSSGTETAIGTLKNKILAKGYFLWENTSGNLDDDPDYATKTYYLSDNYSIALFDDDGNQIDSITWGTNSNPFSGTISYSGNPIKSQALKRDVDDNFSTELNYSPKNSSFINNSELTLCPEEEPETYPDEIQINEILPDPENEESEYIELYNGADEKVDLKNWSLHDASKSGEYIFLSSNMVESKGYLVIYEDEYKFALNNSGFEILTLYDPNKKEISSVSYDGSKNNASYNFNGKNWHWSKFLTPGKENIFEKIPAGELEIDDDVYVNVNANFEIMGLGESAKIVWDFGDGHKSYLKKTKHKYAETGKYEASVKYKEDGEYITKNFAVNVENFPHPKVKIVAVNANPKGSDTDNETIIIKNKSKKKVNLEGWSIATGWKKLYNHPISEKLIIKSGKEKEITREFSKFTLNNEKGKIEIRYPDREVADDVKYKKKEGIAEGEIYVKDKKGWVWRSQTSDPLRQSSSEASKLQVTSFKQNVNSNQLSIVSYQDDIVENKAQDISDEEIGRQTKIKRENILENNIILANIEISNDELRSLESRTIRDVDGSYYFTPEFSEREHYAIAFLKNIIFSANEKINFILNYFSN